MGVHELFTQFLERAVDVVPDGLVVDAEKLLNLPITQSVVVFQYQYLSLSLRQTRQCILECLFLIISELILYEDRKSTRLNSSHVAISYAVFCLKKKKNR